MPTRYTLDVDLKEVATLLFLKRTRRSLLSRRLRRSLRNVLRLARTGGSLPSSCSEDISYGVLQLYFSF
ncbi:hypothetical protein DY000_02060708 [Brassica cretica]|uniref:Uncharacterized protein n=1 Tax=Brassica cretica TaxID=69181 RepID=A0ABQ7AR42_BRACR|nr:hypothetical protein DY000_02060708 [Brassica cretica]